MKKFLIINPFGLGDVLFSMTLVEVLRRGFPGCRIGFLCNERTEGLVRLNPSIDTTFVFHRDLLRRLWKWHWLMTYRKLKGLVTAIREERFDTAFDLSLGREYSFLAWWAGVRERIGFDFKRRGFFLNRRLKLSGYSGRPVADSQLALLRWAGIDVPEPPPAISLRISDRVKNEAEDFLKKSGWTPGETLISLAPGGGRSWGKDAVYKQWDAQAFSEAANRFASGAPCRVALLGDKKEEDLLKETARGLKVPCVVLAGESMEKVGAFLLRSSFLLANDGGLVHLANALKIRTVSIFGPVDETVYGPYRPLVPHRVLTAEVPCRPCYQNFYFPPCPFGRRCLTELKVEKVVEAMRAVA
ncbi:MAG: glycosyltransferase family 9 protein [Candidatus Omnitrophica bacterium]|nr:glycosyltransferase family 9 protein [Candidatus Omnitrophota bacterium]